MSKIRNIACSFALALLSGACAAPLSAAELTCPGGIMKVVMANPAGGTGDLIARVIGEKAGAQLGLPVMVENRPGATTSIGTNYVAKSKADGCTLLTLTASGVVATVYRDKLPYNLTSDFSAVAGVGSFPMVLAVSAASNIRTFEDVAAAIRSKDGIVYASGGAGSLAHLSTVRLIGELGGKGTHVPFKGNSEAMLALLSNQVQMFFPSSAEVIPLVKEGKIRLIGVTAGDRLPALPEVPTMKEFGLADFSPRLWYGFLVPAGTPRQDVSKLQRAIIQAANDKAVQERLMPLGFALEARDGQQLAAYMKTEAARWGKIIADNDLKNAH